jgi:ABC-type branched-subunit amino acid transport system ATPase component
MLSYVEVENFRGFERFRLAGLSRVNLLVGENNCGKSSLLEAVHFLASDGDVQVLLDRARDRGEVTLAEDQERLSPTVAHFFHGHVLLEGDGGFAIQGSAPDDGIRVWVRDAFDLDEKSRTTRELQRNLFDESDRPWPELAFCILREGLPESRRLVALPIADSGVIPRRSLPPYARVGKRENGARMPTMFISPTSLDASPMSIMWDRVLVEGREEEVVAALGILESRLSNVVFLGGGRYQKQSGNHGVYVQFEGQKLRVPLGSLGDGMRRLLAISLALIHNSNGVLLLDEIDTGLHYSVMAKMWHLVVEAARRSNVQVFTTTHSSDCVRGLAQFCHEHPELQQEVSLQKISCELEESVALDAEQIILADEQGMEVR